MSQELNTGFEILAPFPIDSRMVVSTYAGLALIAIKYVGLKTYVVDEDAEYRYYSTGWVKIVTSGNSSGAIWGSITGTLTDQTDLQVVLNTKFDKSGGLITGKTSVTSEVEAYNFILAGSQASEIGSEYVRSTLVGEPSGTSVITNTVFITSAAYAVAGVRGELIATTHYVII